MNTLKRLAPWLGWGALLLVMSGYLTWRWRGPDRTVFLPGPTSHGHYQIELSCSACHTPDLGVREQACVDCHGAELKAVNDSHPKTKFLDPRNADRLKALDAMKCVTCHREHLPDITRAMGVTLPDDYCYRCHQETVRERASHQGLAFNSCATAGCHNYHDNSALYEDFLAKHLHEPKTRATNSVALRHLAAFLTASSGTKPAPLAARQHNAPDRVKPTAALLREWETTAHAQAGVNCADCHNVKDAKRQAAWTARPGHTACAACHQEETSGFLAGKHGMKLAQNLPPMRPGHARLPMKAESAHRELTCGSCHGAHTFDTRRAAVESCLACHDDAHTRAYQASPHFALWQRELKGETPAGSGVSCATCHLPRTALRTEDGPRVLVEHNQNLNLRPNEKMVRSVCLQCHGLGFTLDALADTALVRTNFHGQPSGHVASLDWAERRLREAQKQKPNTQTK